MTKQLDQLEAKLGGTLLDNLSAEASTASVRISFFDSDNPSVSRTPDSGTLKFTLDPENTQGKPSEFLRCVSHSTSNGITTLVTVTRGLQRDATVDLTGSASRAQAWDASTTPVGVSTEPHNMNLVKKYFAGTEPIPGNMEFDGNLQFDGDNAFNGDQTVAGYISMSGTSSYLKVPSLTTAQRLALTAVNGMFVYDSTLGLNYQYKGGAWASIDTGSAPPNASHNVAGLVDIANGTEIGAGTSLDAVSGAINVIPVSQTVKTSSGASDENKIPVLDSTGKLADGFINSKTDELIEAGENVTAGNALRLKIDGKVYKTIDDHEVGPAERITTSATVTNYRSCFVADDKVVLAYLDGANKISVIAATIDGGGYTFGSAVVIDDCTSGTLDLTKLGTDKFVVSYRDTADVNKFKITVCTVSTVTITAGTPVIFETGDMGANIDSQLLSPTTDLGVVVWCDDVTNNELRARAFTVAGTVPTLGAEVSISTVANSGDNFSCAILGTDKFVVTYGGTSADLFALASTISGTTITLGSAVELHDAITISGTNQTIMAAAQVDTDKFAVAYVNTATNKEYLTIATVSGTVITGGTPLELSTNTLSNSMFLIQFSTNQLILWYHPTTFYSASGASNESSLIPGTIAWVTTSGTTPTVNDICNLYSRSIPIPAGYGISRHRSDIKKASDNTFLISLQDSNFDIIGLVCADNNFIGFANSTVTSGNNVSVNFFEDSNQSGLSLGKKYYLNSSGGISLTGQAQAGVAIGTTKILKK